MVLLMMRIVGGRGRETAAACSLLLLVSHGRRAVSGRSTIARGGVSASAATVSGGG